MKINWNKKYNTYAAYACAVGAAIIFFIFLGIHFGKVLDVIKNVIAVFAPIIFGIAIAYVLNPLCKIFENKVFVKIKGRKLKRAIGMTLSYSIFFVTIALLVYAIIPELSRSFIDLQSNLIIYANSLQEWIDSVSVSSPQFGALIKTVMDSIDINSISESITQLFSSLSDILTALAPIIRDFAEVLGNGVKNFFLGLIFSAYFLASKELVTAQVRKLGHALISDEKYEKMSYFIRFSDHTFGRYLIGTFVDSILVGFEFFIVLSIFRFPYAPLVSIVCGFTNMIPIFGPFIGAIPSFLIIFIADPVKALWFILIVLAIQQIDGNIIAPRIIGESTGLSAIAVISAVTIMGGLFGILGMVVGVPLCAVFANLINEKTDERIREKENSRVKATSQEFEEADGAAEKSAESTVNQNVSEKTMGNPSVDNDNSDTADEANEGEPEIPGPIHADELADADASMSPDEKAKKNLSQILRNCMRTGRKGGRK